VIKEIVFVGLKIIPFEEKSFYALLVVTFSLVVRFSSLTHTDRNSQPMNTPAASWSKLLQEEG
jgi:hypothetical protein